MGNLVNAVERYCKLFHKEFELLHRKIASFPRAEDTPHPDSSALTEIVRQAAECAEKSDEFKRLGQVAAGTVHHKAVKRLSASNLKHFFRRSGAYLKIARGEAETPESVAAKLVEELGKAGGSVRVRHLVSLPWAEVEDDVDRVDADWFRLRKHGVDELKGLLEHETRLVFYPESACSEREIRLLSRQWWLEVDDTETLPPLGKEIIGFSAISGTLHLTNLPPRVEEALAIVILLGWKDEHGDRRIWWSGLPLGHRVSLREYLCEWPPSLTHWDYFDVFDSEAEIKIMRYRCSITGKLQALASKVEALAELDQARFITQVVLRYLVKAATASGEVSYKLNQLIDNVIAMDALVGPGRSAISRRVAALCGETAGGNVASRVKRLYDERSALVHGGRVEEINPELSWDAHELLVCATRRAIDLFSAKAVGQELTRDEFLAYLDLLAVTGTTARIGELTERWQHQTDDLE
ncbi:MAG TPA: hypothetical protein EYP63_06750 [Desulfotomaculum sp.]|nr:hypothetical protein [Desulfotomaculum sp.]